MDGELQLAIPAARHKDSYRALVAEFVARGEELIPFTLTFPHENFAAFLAHMAGCERGTGVPEGFVPHSTYWLVRSDEVVGVSNLRHRLTDNLRIEGGHIGYGIRPSARGQRLGTAILRLTLGEAARRGIDRALLTCAKGNAASVAVIRANGGVLDSEEFLAARDEVVMRWWLATARRNVAGGR